MPVIQVRILEPWNGYDANSVLTVTERTYYQNRTDGVKMKIVAESKQVKNNKWFDSLHDRPFYIDEEE